MEYIIEDEDIEALGRSQSPATRRKISKAMTGSGNSQWIDGRRLEYRYKIKKLKVGDKRIIHHKNHDRTDNRPSNLQIVRRKKHEGPLHHRGRNFNK